MGRDPSSAEWMSSEEAKRWLLSTREQPKRTKLYAKCPICGKLFTKSLKKFRVASQACQQLSHACSDACAGAVKRLRTRRVESCNECGKQFERGGSAHKHKHSFCSSQCYAAFRSRTYRGKAHHLYSSKDLSCTQCGTTFKRRLSHATQERTKHPFCSRDCYAEWLRGRPTLKGLGRNGARSYPGEFKLMRAYMQDESMECTLCTKLAKDLHHRDGDIENNTIENLVPLCRSCHSKFHAPESPSPE